MRLTVANAIDPSLTFTDSEGDGGGISGVPHISEYARQYRYSDDVVLGGDALCYFDVFRGTVSTSMNGDAIQTVVTMATNGIPRLSITPLRAWNLVEGGGSAVNDAYVGSTLLVGNQSLPGIDTQYDFLLHLLTAQGGIPQHLPQPPFGFDGSIEPFNQRNTVDQFASTLSHLSSGVPDIDPSQLAAVLTLASCSPSQYP